jgi:SNF2 family DNA or RNA helicase
LFGIHKEMLQPLYEAFKTIAVKIDGSVPANKRQGLVDLFNDTDNIRLMIGNIDAAGVGLNMTSASKVAILELPWTPGALNQAIDRVHRIGQTKGVEVFFLLAIHTIEEELADMLDTKMKTIAAVIDGYDIPDQDLMRELISSIAV